MFLINCPYCGERDQQEFKAGGEAHIERPKQPTELSDDEWAEYLFMRKNINGDFSIVEKLSELKPGAFININWNKKKLMLPYSLRKDYISFTDKKWDWRYQFNKDGSPDINNPSLFEILPSGEVKAHYCQSEEKSSNL